MKTKILALTLATATAFAFVPKPAIAGDKELAVIGGVLGGILIASAIHDHDDEHRTVVVSNGYHHGRNDGYWKTVEVRVWVPGCWVHERHHGRSIRRYVDGHYECRTDRVWVSYDRHHRGDRHDRHDRRDRHDRHDRKYGYGYGHDRDGRHDRR
jgi:hypothetical protein